MIKPKRYLKFCSNCRDIYHSRAKFGVACDKCKKQVLLNCAERFLKRGGFARAAYYYSKAGATTKAKQMYFKSAEQYEKKRKNYLAIKYYKKAGRIDKAKALKSFKLVKMEKK